MDQTIQNGISTLKTLFASNDFKIPQYQRAYSWVQDPHLESFLDDLRLQVETQKTNPDKSYFLGTLLLHEEDIGDGRRVVNIVDGQQRLTTCVILIATALALYAEKHVSFAKSNPGLIRRLFVYDDDMGCQKFQTIQEDQPFFQSTILKISAAGCREDSPSSRRLDSAARYFRREVKHDEWDLLVRILESAKVMVYAVNNAEDATQIFELQNDRGKRLTNLEALKSYLMHGVYLHSPVNANTRLGVIQTQFSTIYRSVESLAEISRAPDENQILANHCAAFLKWSDADYYDPKHLVKATIKSMESKNIVPWIESFVGSLVQTFGAMNELFAKRDVLPEFAELLLLDRMGSFWPLILKTWRFDEDKQKTDFLKVCRLLEVFTFRGYAVANLRSDTGLSSFHTAARDFSGNFMVLFQRLVGLSKDYNLDNRFKDGLDNSYFYQSEGRDALYLLWRYENHLRSQPGKVAPRLTWRDFVEPQSYAAKFSVEHIAAEHNAVSATMVEWQQGEARPFHEVALNRLGNLVIDSFSTNASKGKKDFCEKLLTLQSSTYLSQKELTRFLNDKSNPVWDVEAIRKRQVALIGFAQWAWDPRSWQSFEAKTNDVV